MRLSFCVSSSDPQDHITESLSPPDASVRTTKSSVLNSDDHRVPIVIGQYRSGTFSLMSPVEQCQSSLERSKVSAVIKGAVVDIKPPFGQSIVRCMLFKIPVDVAGNRTIVLAPVLVIVGDIGCRAHFVFAVAWIFSGQRT